MTDLSRRLETAWAGSLGKSPDLRYRGLEAAGMPRVRFIEPALQQQSCPQRDLGGSVAPEARRVTQEAFFPVRQSRAAEQRRAQMRRTRYVPSGLTAEGLGLYISQYVPEAQELDGFSIASRRGRLPATTSSG